MRQEIRGNEKREKRDGSQMQQEKRWEEEMWTQESEKKVVRTRISNEATDNLPLARSLSVHVTQKAKITFQPGICSPLILPSLTARRRAGGGKKTGHGTDGIRDHGLNNEHRQRGRKMQENELISLLVPLVCGA